MTLLGPTAEPIAPSVTAAPPLLLEHATALPDGALLLTAGRLNFGATAENHVPIAIPGVQPRHAQILVGRQRTIVKAWDRRTWINDAPIREAVLRAGDRLTIGPVTLVCRVATSDDLLKLLPKTPATGLPKEPARPATSPNTSPGHASLAGPSAAFKASMAVSVAPIREAPFENSDPIQTPVDEAVQPQFAVPPTASPLPIETVETAESVSERVEHEQRATPQQNFQEQWFVEQEKAIAQLVAREQRVKEVEDRLKRQAVQWAAQAKFQRGEFERIQSQLAAAEQHLSAQQTLLQAENEAWARSVEETANKLHHQLEQVALTEQTQQAREQDIATRLAALEERWQAVLDREEAFAQQKALWLETLTEQQEQQAIHDRWMAEEQARLVAAQQKLAEREQEFEATHQHSQAWWDRQQSQLRTDEQAIARRRQIFEDLVAALEGEVAQQAQHAQVWASRHAELEQREQEIQQQIVDLEQFQQQATAQQARLDEDRQQRLRETEQLQRRSTEIGTAQQRLDERREQIARLEQNLQAGHDQLAVDRQAYAQQQSGLIADQSALEELRQQLSHREEAVRQRESSLHQAEQEVARLANELVEQRQRLDAEHQDLVAQQTLLDSRSREWDEQRSQFNASRAEFEELRDVFQQSQQRAEEESLATQHAVQARQQQLEQSEAQLTAQRHLVDQLQASVESQLLHIAADYESIDRLIGETNKTQHSLAAQEERLRQQANALQAEQIAFESHRLTLQAQMAEQARCSQAEWTQAQQELAQQRQAVESQLLHIAADYEAIDRLLAEIKVTQHKLNERETWLEEQSTVLQAERTAFESHCLTLQAQTIEQAARSEAELKQAQQEFARQQQAVESQLLHIAADYEAIDRLLAETKETQQNLRDQKAALQQQVETLEAERQTFESERHAFQQQVDEQNLLLQAEQKQAREELDQQRQAVESQLLHIAADYEAIDRLLAEIKETRHQLRDQQASLQESAEAHRAARDAEQQSLAEQRTFLETAEADHREAVAALQIEQAALELSIEAFRQFQRDREDFAQSRSIERQLEMEQEHARLVAQKCEIASEQAALDEQAQQLARSWSELERAQADLAARQSEWEQTAQTTPQPAIPSPVVEIPASETSPLTPLVEEPVPVPDWAAERERLTVDLQALADQRAQWEVAQREWDAQRTSVDRREEALAAREAELRQATLALEEQTQDLQQREQFCASQASQLQSREQELATLATQLAEDLSHLQNAREALAAQEALQEETWQERQKSLDQHFANHAQDVEHLQNEWTAVLQQREELVAEQNLLKTRKEDLTRWQAQLETRESTCEERLTALEDAEGELARDRQAFEESQQRFETLGADLEQWAVDLERQEMALAAYEQELAAAAEFTPWLGWADELAEREDDLQQREIDYSYREAALEQQSDTLQLLQQEHRWLVEEQALAAEDAEKEEEPEAAIAEERAASPSLVAESPESQSVSQEFLIPEVAWEWSPEERNSLPGQRQFPWAKEGRPVQKKVVEDEDPYEKFTRPSANEVRTELETSGLRAELARMFNINMPGSAEERFPVPEIEPEPTPESPRTWRDAVKVPKPAPIAESHASNVPEKPLSAEDEDDQSITMYMNRLLARISGNAEESTEPAKPAPVVSNPVFNEGPVPTPTPDQQIDEGFDSPQVILPKAQVDKDAVRQRLQSFRQVANQSARAAVAQHQWRTARGSLIIKSSLSAACFVTGGLLIAGSIMHTSQYLIHGIGCLILSAVAGGDAFLTWRRLNKPSVLWDNQDLVVASSEDEAGHSNAENE